MSSSIQLNIDIVLRCESDTELNSRSRSKPVCGTLWMDHEHVNEAARQVIKMAGACFH